MRKWIIPALILTVGIIGFFTWQNGRQATAESAPDLIALLSEPAADTFTRATIPNNIELPRDLGPHDDYQTEWWYYTGNLSATDGREFGFQFTIFRRALEPPTNQPTNDDQPTSAFRTSQIYLAHFALSDIENNEFYHAERYGRGGAGIAGAQAEPYRVWLEDWQIMQDGETIRLVADADEYALDLELTQTMPVVLHGEGGLSAKSLEVGNASYYYSQIHQQAVGTVRIGAEAVAVTGAVWKDHEYSTSVLAEGAIGWDWFSLHIDDGSALMLFQIRREDGSIEPTSSGTFVYPDGTTESLALADWEIEVLDTWRSDGTDSDYPSEWTLTIPKLELSISGAPKMADQELRTSSGAYWEGAVRFGGERGGSAVSAEGYIEMTGYAR